MPRRRSDGLTLATTAGAASPVALVVLVVFAAGCPSGNRDNGCQVRRQLLFPDTATLSLSDVQIQRAGAGYVVLGRDASTVRWTAIDAGGAFGSEQAFTLPDGALRAYYALAGAESPGDRVVIGVLMPAANGADAELRLVVAPTDGTPAGEPGVTITTFGGGANPQTPPLLAMGTSSSGMYAGVAWADFSGSGLPTYAFVDGQGEIVGGEPAIIETTPASGYSCLGFSAGKEELTITYQRGSTIPLGPPTWMIADVAVGGGINTLTLNVTQPGGVMGCANTVLYDPMNGDPPEYALVWQDPSGSWLSVYYGPQTNTVKSFPFASATDFGGSGLQPPIMGLAAFGSDFGVLFAGAGALELWRIDREGNRRSGSLLYPSLQGSVAGISSLPAPGLLTSTYADLTGADQGRRLVVDAVCY